MKISFQIAIVFLICFIGEIASKLSPFIFPASIASMLILFILLLLKIIKVNSIKEITSFLLNNMAFFYIPPAISIMEQWDFIKNSIVQILFICVVSFFITFITTAYTIKLVIYIQNKIRGVKKC